MEKPFVYGIAVERENFTDREVETQRLKLNFENGINSILISPRRMGKTSLVKRVAEQINDTHVKVIYMDIYKCRTEYDFYEKFASTIIQATSSKVEQMLANAKELIMSIKPKISVNPDLNSEYSLSLGITPKANTPEEILSLPERIAQKKGIRIVVCIDEFQQIGEMPDSLRVQKTLRSVWQHQHHTSYCLFGSKQYMMANLFYSRMMPFYQFGDMFFLKKIPTEKWVPFIVSRFQKNGKQITDELAAKLCEAVENYSSYVQQFAWNVYAMTDKTVTEKDFADGLEALMAQVSPLFVEQTASLTAYQLNFIKAICQDYHNDFGKKEVTDKFDFGTRSNIDKLKSALIDKEILVLTEEGYFISDPLFKLWFKREMM